MELLIGIFILVIMGILLSRLAGIIGANLFKFSQIYGHIQESYRKLKKMAYK
ncbi:hypothetical protein [Lutispora thermophila]|uniref:Uncharacterized protein n=1 Tax=Lutispora thermophila DSM 19022 TaxID=1122184 RepID=A0A1M6B708_9FIRM|nr:hypothetical protein [Lutispora thermophila]SHI44263.1 hypothetical protein SAMN02745176_00295 [Lutispora thermophila DSM 19022]